MRRSFILGLVITLACCGCSRTPPPPPAPKITPEVSARQAIEMYDANQDGKIDAREVLECPGLADARERIDSNKDGAIDAQEIAARINYWINSGTITIDGSAEVYRNGAPFLICQGKTNDLGEAYVSGVMGVGLYPGIYRIRISKREGGTETLPAKFNSETELGIEISDDIFRPTGIIRIEL